MPLLSSTIVGVAGMTPDDVKDPDAARLVASLRSALDQQELGWRAEKATLDEFYEASARSLQV